MRTRQWWLGSGVWLTALPDEVRKIEIGSMRAFRDALGDDIAVSLARAMFALDRLHSMHTVAKLNASLPDEPDSKIMRSRNHLALISVAWGYVHEFASALHELAAAGVRDMLTNPAKWDDLAELQRIWYGDEHDPLAKRLRHALAFHPGDRDSMRASLEQWPDDERVDLHEGKGPYARNSQWSFGVALVLRSEGIELETLLEFVDKTIDLQFEAYDLLSAMLVDLLKTCDGKKRIAPPRVPRFQYRPQGLSFNAAGDTQVEETSDGAYGLQEALDLVAQLRRAETSGRIWILLDAKKTKIVDEQKARIRLASDAKARRAREAKRREGED